MYEFLVAHQLDILLVLSGICGMNAVFVCISKFLTVKRKTALIMFELSTMVLLLSDRLTQIYSGDTSPLGFKMMRTGEFLVYFLTIFILFSINLYLEDILKHEGEVTEPLIRFKSVNALVVLGAFLVILSQFTGYYYFIDEMNEFQRGANFNAGFIIPSIINFLQMTVILQYYKRISTGIRVSLLLFTFVPFLVSLCQIYFSDVSLTIIAFAIVAIVVYLLSLVDLNNSVEKENRMRVEKIRGREESANRMFEELSLSITRALDERDLYTNGHSERVAKYSEMIAERLGENESECRKIYCAALLHDAGKIGIKEDLLEKYDDMTDEEKSEFQKHTILGAEILSGIEDAPFLAEGARYHHENYDGSGYPYGLRGEHIPLVARIIAVADAYDHLTSSNYFRDALPQSIVREEVIESSGIKFDPAIADILVSMIDSDPEYRLQEKGDMVSSEMDKEITCTTYKSSFTKGIPITGSVTRLSLKCRAGRHEDGNFCMPSLILFDSLDGRVHENKRAISVYKYLEYGEIWFDGHFISTNARKIKLLDDNADDEKAEVLKGEKDALFEILMSRYKDHVKIVISGDGLKHEFVAALPDSSRYAYLSLTGENCHISDIAVEENTAPVAEGDIERISDEISFIDRIESDMPNIQIDENMSAFSKASLLKNGTRIIFFTKSLPTADLVWHCPYLVIFSSEDGKVFGKDYREYALIKINGEATGDKENADNILTMKREDNFVGWEKWKQLNREGFEVKIYFRKKGNRITTITENLGVYISNVTVIKEMPSKVYVAITGDQCAITDIRVM